MWVIKLKTCIVHQIALKLLWGRKKQQDIFETEACCPRKMQQKGPFVQHFCEFGCKKTLIKFKRANSAATNLIWDQQKDVYNTRNINMQPVNLTSTPHGASINEIFLAPFQEFFFMVLCTKTWSIIKKLIRRSIYINQSEMVSLWTFKAFPSSSRLPTRKIMQHTPW